MSKRRLILAGGGSADDSRPLDALLAGWLGATGRLLYLPIAMEPKRFSYATAFEWVCGVFKPLGVRDIQIWSELKDKTPSQLEAFDAIYIGGGNTYRLLNLLRSAQFDQALLDFVQRGGAVYGGSAGAIILGRDIDTCAHSDANNAGLADTRGLDLAGGFAIWCHYQPAEDALIRRYLDRSGIPVLALPERAGIKIEDDTLYAAGYDSIFRFMSYGKTSFAAGAPVR